MSARPTFSILHTSARPDAWARVADAWLKAAARPEDVEYVLVVDPRWGFAADDEPMEIRRSLMRPSDKIVINTGRMCYVDGVNIAAENATGQILIVVADDQFPCDQWDHELRCWFNLNQRDYTSELVLRVPTGTPQEVERNITVMPIVSRARYERLGYIFYPGYESMFADNDLSEHAQHDDCFVDLANPEIVNHHIVKLPVFPHRHPWFHNKTIMGDPAYIRQNRPEAYELGARVLAERRASGFGSKLAVVPAVVPSATVPNTGKNLALCIPGEMFHSTWVAANALQLSCHLFNRFRNVGPVMPVQSSVYTARHSCFEYIKALPYKSDYVLWIDDDNLLMPEQFEMLMRDLDTHPEIAGVFGWCWIVPDARISCGAFDEHGICHSFDYDKLMAADGDLVPVDWSGFPVLLHRGALIDEIGEFPFRAILNDKWKTGMTGEDVAFCMHAAERGLKLVCDRRVKVPHLRYGIPEPDWMMTKERKALTYGEMVTAPESEPAGSSGDCSIRADWTPRPKGLLDKVRRVVGL